MHQRDGFAELIALAIVIAALIAVMEVPADAATRVEHHHRITTPYSGYALEHEPSPERGYSWPNPDRGPYPPPCNGASC